MLPLRNALKISLGTQPKLSGKHKIDVFKMSCDILQSLRL